MPWHYLYDAASGRLLSEASELPVPDVGQLLLTRATRAPDSDMWDAATRSFIPRPPKVAIDRIADLEGDAALGAVWTRLTAAQRTALKNRLAALLGPARYRAQGESVDLGGWSP